MNQEISKTSSHLLSDSLEIFSQAIDTIVQVAKLMSS
jgi:hypothetical protein